MKKIGIWIRVSTSMQVEQETPETHIKRAQLYAELHECKIVKTYRLDGVSGKAVMDHPETLRMLDDVEKGRIDALVFSKLARLGRNTRDLLTISDHFKKYDTSLISISESFDTGTPAGKLLFTILGALAELERDEISSRVKESVVTRSQLGLTVGGQAPFGYKVVDKKYVLDENEAPIRKEMFELYIKHKKKKMVAHILNGRGYTTRRGGKFSSTTLTRLLTDPIAYGMKRANYTKANDHDGGWTKKSEDQWVYHQVPAIVSKEVFDQVQEILKSQKVNQPKNRKTHLFTGYLTCGCGGRMRMETITKKYVCIKCRNKIHRDILEEAFVDNLDAELEDRKDIETQKEIFESKLKHQESLFISIEKQINELNTKIDRYYELFECGEIPAKGFRLRISPLEEQRDKLLVESKNISNVVNSIVSSSSSLSSFFDESRSTLQNWNTLSAENKRYIIESITDEITLSNTENRLEIKLFNMLLPYFKESFQMGNESMPLWLL